MLHYVRMTHSSIKRNFPALLNYKKRMLWKVFSYMDMTKLILHNGW